MSRKEHMRRMREHGPDKPALNHGRVQKAVVNLFLATGRREISAREAADWAYGAYHWDGRKLKPRHYNTIKRAFRRIARPVGREATGSGRSMRWELTVDLDQWFDQLHPSWDERQQRAAQRRRMREARAAVRRAARVRGA